jgi:hypothetical protein
VSPNGFNDWRLLGYGAMIYLLKYVFNAPSPNLQNVRKFQDKKNVDKKVDIIYNINVDNY